ncbi:alanyl-tRNA editing protein [Acidihalobacter prosperus]|uniref:Threonyl/alanyl tRNA synthetase SAD domain-containing protein n=1 Tax=Acidihalobacter prosperus TaxID=160660 RepID=A0A1A6C3Z1_9GAMM|nr:hypothetical protein [Acidihalobacter prosperus]OBS09278.1 hypothetical protein Thpro_021606 [Acidihalobacter prosperus]
MTLRKYFLSDELASHARVLSCSGSDDGNTYRIVMDETLFHPQGGGQPADQGWIGGVRVLHVSQEQGDIVHHAEAPVARGEIDIHVDEALRHLHSRLHSAGHLIGHVGALLGWQPIKAQHARDQASVTFKPGEQAQPLDEATLQAHLDDLLRRNLPKQTIVDAKGFRTVGFGELPPFPCGGTHVASTGEIGGIVLKGVHDSKGTATLRYDVRT